MKTSTLLWVSVMGFSSVVPATVLRADLLLRQDFNAATGISSLLDTTSSDTSRFYDISATAAGADALPDVQSGFTEEQRLPGVANLALVGGKLSFSLRGAWQTYYQNGQDPSTRQRAASASNGQIVRLFPPGSRPDRLFFRFKVHSLAPELAEGSGYLEGPALVRILAGKPLLTLSVERQNSFRVDRAGPDLFFDGQVEVTVLINKSPSSLTYVGPDGLTATVGSNAYDAWVDQTLAIDEGEYPSITQIDSAQIRLSAAIGRSIIDLGGGQFGVPSNPGEPFSFELDDVLLRSDFDETGPSPLPDLTLSGNLRFGTRTTGSQSSKSMLIRNSGDAPLSVTDVRMPAPVFSGSFRGLIPPGASRSVAVKFRPTRAKTYRGNVMVFSNAPDSPKTLPVSGTGRSRRGK